MLIVHAWLKYIAVNKSNNVSAPQLKFLQGCHRVSNRLESNTASRQLENPHDPSYPEYLQKIVIIERRMMRKSYHHHDPSYPEYLDKTSLVQRTFETVSTIFVNLASWSQLPHPHLTCMIFLRDPSWIASSPAGERRNRCR